MHASWLTVPLLVLAGCADKASERVSDSAEKNLQCYENRLTARVCNVSLISIIASPSEYDGMRISIKGYASANGLGRDSQVLLFADSEHSEFSIVEDSVVLRFKDKRLEQKIKSAPPGYIRAYGVFHAGRVSLGAAGGAPGSLDDIYLIGHDVHSPWSGPSVDQER